MPWCSMGNIFVELFVSVESVCDHKTWIIKSSNLNLPCMFHSTTRSNLIIKSTAPSEQMWCNQKDLPDLIMRQATAHFKKIRASVTRDLLLTSLLGKKIWSNVKFWYHYQTWFSPEDHGCHLKLFPFEDSRLCNFIMTGSVSFLPPCT